MSFNPFAPKRPPLFDDQWAVFYAVAEQDEDGKRLKHTEMCEAAGERLRDLHDHGWYGIAATILQQLREKDLVRVTTGLRQTWSLTQTGRLLLEVKGPDHG